MEMKILILVLVVPLVQAIKMITMRIMEVILVDQLHLPVVQLDPILVVVPRFKM